MIRLPEPRTDTVGDVLPLLNSAPWQRELLMKRLRNEWWSGWWWAAPIWMVLGGLGGWLFALVVRGAP